MNTPLQASIRAILEHPTEFAWTVQGFGFMRCYLTPDKRWRLNVWDSELATNASLIHDHPWNFTSYIIAGALYNFRYTENEAEGDWYTWGLLLPGIGGGLTSAPQGVKALWQGKREEWLPGDVYTQKHREIHHTEFGDGTVTLNDRIRPHGGKDIARIFWPAGEQWQDAMPRDATAVEVLRTTAKALATIGDMT